MVSPGCLRGQGGINKDAINANSGPYLCGQSALVWEEGRKFNCNGKIYIIQMRVKRKNSVESTWI